MTWCKRVSDSESEAVYSHMETLQLIGAGVRTLLKGGPMLLPLVFFSFLATSIVLERLAYLRRDRLIPADYIGRIYRLIDRGKYDMAVALCDNRPLLITEMLRTGIVNRGASEPALIKAVTDHIRQHGTALYRHLSVLGMVAAIAPLLGLLGTVIGMIYSFGALQREYGDVDLRVVADGISVALLTTFAGLVIAVPSLVAHQYLTNRADQYRRELRRYGVSLVRFLKSEELRMAGHDAAFDEPAELEFASGTEG